ncbi:MAG: hypothetical protein RR482_07470, partial [Clostridia bacterium]
MLCPQFAYNEHVAGFLSWDIAHNGWAWTKTEDKIMREMMVITLGPGDAQLLTRAAEQALRQA